jgi:putative peptide zinc metalloprotease protein
VLLSPDVLELVLPDQTRLALGDGVTIGRAPENTVQLSDPSVSRLHARICPTERGAILEDAGSSYGTWLDGRRVRAPAPLRAGSRIRVGNQHLAIDRPRADDEPGLTTIVPEMGDGATPDSRPRLRSGYALKRLEAGEGAQRWVLEDLRSERFVRLSDPDAALVALVDGTRTTEQLADEAQRRGGTTGAARLSLLLAALGERGVDAASLLKTTIYVVAERREDLVAVWGTVRPLLGRAPSTLVGVSFLGYRDQLVEIEAIASSSLP